VDKSSNNQLFLSFIGMLRNKYLQREVGKDYTFKSVILAGVYDVKSLKLKLRNEEEARYNSPWNIAVDFKVDMSFSAFIKPIINGTGFDFKEVEVSEEKRLDVVITYNSFKYIIEMKIWRGEKYHEEGIKQLCDYLHIHSLDTGYLVIFNFNKNKEFKEQKIVVQGKEIFLVYV
jgi:hypothetical protein